MESTTTERGDNMELKGKWACPEFYDSQINITEDGRVSCEFAEMGEYGVTPEFTIDGDKIKFSACRCKI